MLYIENFCNIVQLNNQTGLKRFYNFNYVMVTTSQAGDVHTEMMWASPNTDNNYLNQLDYEPDS